MKIVFRIILWAAIGLVLFFIFSNLWVVYSTKKYVFNSLDSIPATDVALVLGTSKKLTSGEANPYFDYRIEAAALLFKSGKVKHLILSGDNETKYYNEPKYMKDALLEKDIPERAITLDYAGFRTLDSVVRGNKIFGQKKFIIVTQQFHAYRAVFIGRQFDIEVIAFAAENISLRKSLKVLLRELLARPKAVLDIFVLDINPRVLGEKENIYLPEFKVN